MRAIPVEPSNKKSAIGQKLRAVRQAQQLTIEQVAQATGLSKGFISRVERDVVSISVASLVAFCEVLSLPVGSLFDNSADAHLVRRDTGPHINLGGEGTEEWLLTPRDESRLQLVHSKCEPHGHGGEELYTVNSDVEVLYVIKGSVELRFSDHSWTLDEGDAITFSGRTPHSWRVAGDASAEVLWFLVPAAWQGTT